MSLRPTLVTRHGMTMRRSAPAHRRWGSFEGREWMGGPRATAHIQDIWVGGFPGCIADRYKIGVRCQRRARWSWSRSRSTTIGRSESPCGRPAQL